MARLQASQADEQPVGQAQGRPSARGRPPRPPLFFNRLRWAFKHASGLHAAFSASSSPWVSDRARALSSIFAASRYIISLEI